MSYVQYVIVRNALRKSVAETGAVLGAFPKGEMGLTPDDVKASPEYRKAKAAYDHAFHALRAVNAKGTKLYKKELAKEREERRNRIVYLKTFLGETENDAC